VSRPIEKYSYYVKPEKGNGAHKTESVSVRKELRREYKVKVSGVILKRGIPSA